MKKLFFSAIAFSLLFSSCTENERAKNFGGNTTIDLPKGEKLVNVTWKEDELWYLTRPMTAADSAVNYTFREKSSFGVWEGTVTLKESK
jgi:hypothetical protein